MRLMRQGHERIAQVKRLRWIPAIVGVAMFGSLACTIPVERHDWSAYDGPGAEHFQQPQYPLPFHEDPLEPVNRIAFGVNAAFVVAVAEPIASGWRYLVPQDVRTSLVRASDNLEFPRRGLNNLLQGNTQQAGDETARFAINSTAGVAGLEDAARPRGLLPADTTTGRTFQKWGWEDRVYLTLPLGLPGTTRDVVGSVGDALLDPTLYFFPAAPIKGFIQAAERLNGIERFVTTNQDPYEILRRMYMAQREATNAGNGGTVPLEGPAQQTIRYAMLQPRDVGFDLRAKTRRVRIAATDEKLPYDVWMQKSPAPLVVLLPGFGGHRESTQNMAIAEIFYDAGYSVATISSAANFEFMRKAATTPYPGFTPVDAMDVQRALVMVCRDLTNEYGDRITKKALVGASFGGGHALFIAAMRPRERMIDFDAYLAICPPIRFDHAARSLDAYYNIPMSFPEAERDARVTQIMKTGSALAMGGNVASDDLGITEEEAAFLVGLNYRLSLHDVIWVSRQRDEADIEILRTRWNALQKASASQEILGYSLMKYAYAFLLPPLMAEPVKIDRSEELFARSDTRTLEGRLRARENVGVAINANDFLLAPGDEAWLRGVFGEARMAVSPDGGHLGNLHEDVRRASIVLLLNQLLQSQSEPRP